MKTFKNLKYLGLVALAISITACNKEEDFEEFLDQPPVEEAALPALTSGDADFSNYVAIGASFTAGFTDGGLFIAGQEDSFPNTLSKQFAKAGGGTFTQPLMDDNTGGILVGGTVARGYRFVFGGAGPVALDDFLASQGAPVPPITTEAGVNIGSDWNNFGIPGAKSWHLVAPGYAAANPFYARIASSASATVLGDAVAQNPTFFTLSEVGGNDVLGYALSGGESDTTAENYDPITPVATFDNALNALIAGLTSNPNTKGAVGNVPDITSLAHFTTVPYNPLEPSNPDFGPQIPLLNSIFGALNPIFNAVDPSRAIVFSETENSPVVIFDENLADISATITNALSSSPTFPAFIAQFGLPPAAADTVAALLGSTYGQTRQATENDLFVLPSSSIIGTVNNANVAILMGQGLPQALAGQFSVEGVTLPLADKWTLTPQEQQEIATATAAYNSSISSIVSSNGLALVDLNTILNQAASAGIQFDDYNMNTSLVFGGLVSLDGVHLTARGYALMANSFLDAIDTTYGSNFRASGNVAKADDFGVNYSALLP
ncbi:MAG: G-D-S-L family lipolytic protein [Lacinutrix venerupis]